MILHKVQASMFKVIVRDQKPFSWKPNQMMESISGVSFNGTAKLFTQKYPYLQKKLQIRAIKCNVRLQKQA